MRQLWRRYIWHINSYNTIASIDHSYIQKDHTYKIITFRILITVGTIYGNSYAILMTFSENYFTLRKKQNDQKQNLEKFHLYQYFKNLSYTL